MTGGEYEQEAFSGPPQPVYGRQFRLSRIDAGVVALHINSFSAARDWEQFHTPKNLAMALAGEAGELLEIFQWLTAEESERVDRHRAGEELADVMIYAIRMADVLDIDLAAAIWAKLEKNAERYPVGKAKGNATKYTKL